MEFRPSPRDVIDAFEKRIADDNDYVIDCLIECGLDPEIRNHYYAMKRLLTDFREHYETKMDNETFDVTETFSSFVDEQGRYHRTSPDQYIGSLVIELGEDERYSVYTNRRTMEGKFTEEEFTQED